MTRKEDDMIPKDPYEGVKPEFLPIDEFQRRFPYGLSRADFNRYRVIGVYHSLLPQEVQDRLKKIPFYTEELPTAKLKRDYGDKVIAEIVEQYPEYFREGLLAQLKKVATEMARAERIAENRRKRMEEKAKAEAEAEESENSESVQSETENKPESKPKSKPVVLHLLLPNHGNGRKKKAIETEIEKETEKESESEP